MEYPKFKVCVTCFTFNQAEYITDAMNGFTMQQTDFPFVCCIVDDASTDGEPVVISGYLEEHFDFSEGSVACKKETDYAHIIYAQHKTNRNCYFAVLYLKENHYSQKKDKFPYLKEWRDLCEYEALCEGDDYWIVADKLQRQVDFLEEHQDYSMCFHNASIKDEAGTGFKTIYVEDRDYKADELYEKWVVPTASILIKKCALRKNSDDRLLNGDIFIVLSAAAYGKVRGLKNYMSVYRVQCNGLTLKRQIDDPIGLCLRYIKHYEYLKEMFPNVSLRLHDSLIANACINYGVSDLKNQPCRSIYYIFKALFVAPRQFIKRLSNYLYKCITTT